MENFGYTKCFFPPPPDFPFPCFLSHLPSPPQSPPAEPPAPARAAAGGGGVGGGPAGRAVPCRAVGRWHRRPVKCRTAVPCVEKETFFSSRWRVSYSRTQAQEGKDQVVSQSPLAFDRKQRRELFLWPRSFR